MGKTLFNMMVEKVKKIFHKEKVENKLNGPLAIKANSIVLINDIDNKDIDFKVDKIHCYQRIINGKKFEFFDYDLKSSGQNIRLRYNPIANPDVHSELTHNVIILNLYHEQAYNEELYKSVTDTTKIFEVFDAGVLQERYFRINDVEDSYKATVFSGDPIKPVPENLEETKKIEYWDYSREIKDAAGLPLIQCLFIEMDSVNGWFQMWRGVEVDSQQILI